MKNSRGVILIVCLWISGLIIWLATGTATVFRFVFSSEAALISRFNARYAAFGGIQEALARMGWRAGEKIELEDVGRLRWRPDGAVHVISYSRCSVNVRIEEEDAKVNVNMVDEAEFKRILVEKSELDEETAVLWRDRILDFIDGDDISRDNGAEVDDYKSMGLTYGPQNRPVERIEQVLLVPGIEWNEFWYGKSENGTDDILPGRTSFFSLFTVYGDRKVLSDDAENGKLEGDNGSRIWKNGGLYRIVSGARCGQYGLAVIYAIVKINAGAVPPYRIVEIKEML